jgi:hypothetical protein
MGRNLLHLLECYKSPSSFSNELQVTKQRKGLLDDFKE